MADQTDEILTHTIKILRVAAGLRKDAIDVLVELQATLIGKIERYNPDTLKGARLRALLKQTDESIAAAYREVLVNQDAGLRAIAGLEGRFAVKTINGAIGAPLVSVAIPEKLLEAAVDGDTIFGHSAKAWWQAQADDLRFKFRGTMQQAVLMGETIDQMARRVRGTKEGEFQDGLIPSGDAGGLIPKKKREAEALVRSSAIAVANDARLRSYAEMGDILRGIMWVATLDSRTTDICKALSGKQWSFPDMEPIDHDKVFPGPTAHWNCRSTQVSVLKSLDELAGKKLPSLGDQEVEERMREILEGEGWSKEKAATVKRNMRASMDGPISRATTFDDWLKGKPDSFINETLGPGRARLFREGKVTLSELTDQTNRPLRLDELE